MPTAMEQFDNYFSASYGERRTQNIAMFGKAAVQANERRLAAIDAAASAARSTTSAAKARASGASPAPKAPTLSPAAIAQAQQAAAKAKRRDAVMGSPHAQGRQRTAKAMLEAPANWTAAQIVAELPKMPTDAQLDAKLRREASDAVWDRANAKVAPRARTIDNATGSTDAAEPASRRAASDAVWDRAWGRSSR